MLLLVAACSGALLVGHAAGLAVGTASMGAGNAGVPDCDSNGFTPTYTVSSGRVTAVTVSAIADPACEGGAISLTLTNSSNVSIGSGGPVSVPTDGDTADNSATVSVSPQAQAPQVVNIHISIVGP